MSREQFLLVLDDLFELPSGTLRGPEPLASFKAWDSLGIVTYMGISEEHFGQAPPAKAIQNCATAGDLYELASGSH